ncbi:putative dehydrogenase [Bacillus ectoiniformans]|uniref:Gfo/Idh/MocA family protein n=1 Tax=Bacillus ectoiniformans TaxID=1494429 RepID=UPI00195E30DB|nr:Gfo/Idh/MocA family oxidoreductase [Bacillus ectoiniformans]MBM7649371.1 putative dehydrogenase [Bacillus ectoiniformans]
MKNIAVVGGGNWGKNLIRTFFELSALAAIVETSESLREEIKSTYPSLPVYSTIESVKKDPSIQGVVVATPASTHFEIAKECLTYGKDVFIEKPMTLSSKDGESLEKIAQLNECILMVGHLLLYQPAIQKMKAVLDSGEIGQIVSLHQQRLKLGRVRSVENVLWSFGVHDLAVFLYLIGEQPSEMQCVGQNVLQPSIEDDVYLHLTFENGVKAHLHTSWLYPEVVRKLVVIGTMGMLVYDEVSQKVTLHQKGIHSDLSNRDEGHKIIFHGESKPLTIECQHFLECIEKRKQPISDGANGTAVVRILEKALR